MSWTDERVDMLRRLWSEGKSASQIAEILGGVSRNAVIGKAHRLGLSGRPSPIKRKEAAAPRKGVDILSLTERMCKWPIGDPRDPEFHFCGKESLAGRPYCSEHCALAYQSAAKAKDEEDKSKEKESKAA